MATLTIFGFPVKASPKVVALFAFVGLPLMLGALVFYWYLAVQALSAALGLGVGLTVFLLILVFFKLTLSGPGTHERVFAPIPWDWLRTALAAALTLFALYYYANKGETFSTLFIAAIAVQKVISLGVKRFHKAATATPDELINPKVVSDIPYRESRR